MKAGDRERVTALRTVLAAVQQATKDGEADELKVLRRERKRRMEAAEAYEGAGSSVRAEAERSEAELISGYLPAELSDQELAEIVTAKVAEAGVSDPSQIGAVMKLAVPAVDGRADGKRVQAEVLKALGA